MQIIDGKYVSSGNKNLYVKTYGKGSPAVVFEPDYGGLSIEWEGIQTEISNLTSTVTYDRAGYGESPKGDLPRNSRQIASELFTMLSFSDVPEPYIFVGHSAGSLYVLHYARMFPRDVAGLLLVDPITPNDDEFNRLNAPKFIEQASSAVVYAGMKKYAEMEKEEYDQNVIPWLKRFYSEMPPYLAGRMEEYQCRQDFFKTIVHEYDGRQTSFELLSQPGEFPDIPIKILSRDFNLMIKISQQIGIPENEARMVEELWLKNCKDLLSLSTKSSITIVEGADHNMHYSAPNAIIDSIKELIEIYRFNNNY